MTAAIERPDDGHMLWIEHLDRVGFVGPRFQTDAQLWTWADGQFPDRIVNVIPTGEFSWAAFALDTRPAGGTRMVRHDLATIGELRAVFRTMDLEPEW